MLVQNGNIVSIHKYLYLKAVTERGAIIWDMECFCVKEQDDPGL